jgi:hypothetical protein
MQPVPETRSGFPATKRAASWFPIWPCSRRGFPRLRDCSWSGGLLPHPFTLTGLTEVKPAVCSLWHFPSAGLAPVSRVYPLRVTRRRALWSSDFPPAVASERFSALSKSQITYAAVLRITSGEQKRKMRIVRLLLPKTILKETYPDSETSRTR